jgi:hypothetical protein
MLRQNYSSHFPPFQAAKIAEIAPVGKFQSRAVEGYAFEPGGLKQAVNPLELDQQLLIDIIQFRSALFDPLLGRLRELFWNER